MRYTALVESCRRAVGEPSTNPLLAKYLEKVRRYAYKVTDEEFEALKAAGFDDDALFHATAAEATKAGMDRLAAGLKALGVER
jgi:hypothetical protein